MTHNINRLDEQPIKIGAEHSDVSVPQSSVSQASDGESNSSKKVALLIVKAIVGTIMLCVGFANIFNLMGWSEQYNQVLVFFGFFLWMSAAGMLFWSGVKGILKKVKEASE